MLKNFMHDIALSVQARSGITPSLFVWLAIVTLALFSAFAFLCVAGYAWLAFIAVLASAVSLFYYFRIAAAMFFVEGSGSKLKSSYALSAVVLICAAGTLLIGIAPQPFVEVLKACVLQR